MLAFFLVLAWITPAFIAGMLGWSGIWGAGSALVEYLIQKMSNYYYFEKRREQATRTA